MTETITDQSHIQPTSRTKHRIPTKGPTQNPTQNTTYKVLQVKSCTEWASLVRESYSLISSHYIKETWKAQMQPSLISFPPFPLSLHFPLAHFLPSFLPLQRLILTHINDLGLFTLQDFDFDSQILHIFLYVFIVLVSGLKVLMMKNNHQIFDTKIYWCFL